MMRLRRSFGYRCFSLLLAGSIAASVLGAQTVPGNFAQGRAESGTSGAATASVRLERMLLLLQGPGSQQTKLDTLLNAQQTVGNAQYHAWLTAAEFGQQFGPSAGDTAAVVGWLKAQGFRVAALPAGRQWIEFSGTLAQTEQAFGVRVTAVGARYQMTGQAQLPAGIAAQVAGLVSLDGELAAAAATIPVASSEDARALVATAGVAAGALTGPIPPAAASALLKRSGLAAEWNGQGETIAIPSRSAIAPEDVAAFRDSFGLAANEVELSTAAQKTAVDRTGDEAATLLAASWAGVTAPGARILVVPAATTNATDGLDLALAATVDGELAHTVTVGYTACESGLSAAHGAFYAAVYQQAAAEGIAVVAATGDSGAAACHVGGDSAPVTTGYGVNALAATPWNTAVGAAATLDGKAAGWGQATATDAAYATGGGVSQVYARPGWQAAEGVPASDPAGDTASGVGSGHHRYLPDVVMPAAAGSASGLAYCYAGETGADGCWLVTGGGSAGAAAMFAGLAAVVAQKYGPQGNVAGNLYALSRDASAGAVEDIAAGNARLVCVAGSAGCGQAGSIGFAAEAGYDLATGLGTVNAAKLVENWLQAQANGSLVATIVETNPAGVTLNPGATLVLSSSVSGTGGQPTPTGTVQFFDDTTLQDVGSQVSLDSSGHAFYTETGQLAVGGHNIEAVYSGDSNYQSGNSQPVTINVQPSTTTTVVSASTTTPTAGQTITVTVTISAANPGATPPTGTVNVTLDGISQGYASLSTNNSVTSAQLSVTIPGGASTYTLQGIYGGDANYDQSTSSVLTLTLTKGTTTTTLTASPSIVSSTTPETLTATVAAAASSSGNSSTITGSVTFYDGTTAVGTSPVSGGTAVLAGVVLSATTTHSLTAVYSGDVSWNGSTSPVVVLVGPSATTTVITPATLTPTAGSTLSVTGVVTGATTETSAPSGTLSVTVDGLQAGVTSVSGSGNRSTGQVTLSSIAPGTHTLAGIYSGDTNYSASTSAGVTITVAKGTTTTVMTASSTVVNSTTPETLTATVAASSGSSISAAITGTVTFFDGTSTLGVATVNGGSAVLAGVFLPSATTHSLTAVYSGDTNWSGSTSPVVVLQGPTTTVTVITPSTTTPLAGSTLTVTGVISGAVSEASAPSGTLTVNVDGVASGLASVTGSGNRATGQVSLASLTPGSHLLVGVYSGDSYYNASTSSAVTVTVAKGSTVTTLVATPTTLTTGVPETFTATVAAATSSSGLTTPITGTVLFYDGTTLLGSGAVSSGSAVLGGVVLLNTVSHTITAVYTGDSNWTTSASAAVVLEPTLLPVRITLVLSSSVLSPGQTATLTATVSPVSLPPATAEQNPSGTVLFYAGTTLIGSTSLGISVGDTSVATIPVPSLAAGQYSITAVYEGDLTYGPATSSAVILQIEDFSISSNITNINMIQGTTAQVPFTVTSSGGLTGPIEVVCAEQNPPSQGAISCIFSPTIVNGTGQTLLTIITTAGSASTATTAKNEPKPMGPMSGLALAGACLLLWPIGRRAGIFRRGAVGRVVMLALLLTGLAGAGLGCTNTVVVTGQNGTPLGVHTLKITAAAYVNNVTVSHSTFLTVNVEP